MMLLKSNLWTAFWAGVVFEIGEHMFMQDWYGLERWIALERAGWITMSPVWGLGLAGVGALMLIHELGKRKQENTINSEALPLAYCPACNMRTPVISAGCLACQSWRR